MSNETFADILGTTVDNIPRPSLIPVGPWLLRGEGATSKDTTYTDKKSGDEVHAKIFTFRLKPLEAGAGVNAAEVADEKYVGKDIYHTVFVPLQDDGMPVRSRALGLKQFLATWGMTDTDELDQFAGKVAAAQVIVITKKNKDGEDYLDNAARDFEPATSFVSA
jgi:hypothetical protein